MPLSWASRRVRRRAEAMAPGPGRSRSRGGPGRTGASPGPGAAVSGPRGAGRGRGAAGRGEPERRVRRAGGSGWVACWLWWLVMRVSHLGDDVPVGGAGDDGDDEGVAGDRLGVRAFEIAVLVGPGPQPRILHRRGARHGAEGRQGDLDVDAGVGAGPVRHHLGPDQQLAALISFLHRDVGHRSGVDNSARRLPISGPAGDDPEAGHTAVRKLRRM